MGEGHTKRAKEFSGVARDPETQFQIGDAVTYLPEGVHTTVTGYIWHQTFGSEPQIVAYALDCGINIHGSLIARRELGSGKPGQSRFP